MTEDVGVVTGDLTIRTEAAGDAQAAQVQVQAQYTGAEEWYTLQGGSAIPLAGRSSETCGLHVEDLDLRLDDEHVRIHGKGGSVRTVLLDDRGYVALLKLYLARAGHTAGPLFRASINGRGGPLSYDAAHHRRQGYCAQAGVEIDIHQLRHAHATELINAGVSIEAVRRRLGHASAETAQLYALLDDKVADAEIRAARRRHGQVTR
ncbi:MULTISPECIES: tyrosine-type recombinase/integrase [Streptosporangium]|uniref:Integrase n=1 Tax=Streptosporangium brasiliense TaxID=47480 RepID=A0ABT9RKV4_9ACTN|nr:site-specific integrase [Streptosporangium brasiliense]MDP9868910.1 integrase [Streptosporangium brasiliense]